MENKLECVACDLDGSLLNKEKKISPEDLKTIKKLKEKGVKFFICTGRPFPFAKQVAYEVGFDSPVSNCNGAYAYDYLKNEPVYNVDEIPGEDVLKIYGFCKENNYPYMIYALENVYFDNPYSKRSLYWFNQLENNFSKENAFEVVYFDPDKIDLKNTHFMKIILPYVPEETKDIFNEKFNRDGKYEVMFSEKGVLDINAKGINKGFALKKLSEIYHFNLKNTLVLGDNFNDEPMLKACGYPVVPENAEEEMKKLATFITSSNSDSPLTTAINKLFKDLLD